MPKSRGSQAGPSRQRQQQRRGDLNCLAGMISPERLITYITAAACSAVCQHVRVCLLLIFSPACVSICDCPRFTTGPGKRALRYVLMGEVLVGAGPDWSAVRPLRRSSYLTPVAPCTISLPDANRKSSRRLRVARSAPLGGPQRSRRACFSPPSTSITGQNNLSGSHVTAGKLSSVPL